MTTNSSFIKRYSVLIYFVLTFAISWGIFLAVIGGPSGIPGTPDDFAALLPFAILSLLAGPSITGLLMTALADGRSGFRALFSHLGQWRVGIRWYIVAILTAPISVTVGLLVLSQIYGDFLPRITTAGLIQGIVGGLVVGFLEELGWTGFAVPKLRLRYRALATALIIGSLWGAWHLLTNLLWATDSYAGVFSLPVYLLLRGIVFIVGQLLAYRVLLVWVYDRTESLPVVMLMHASLTASALILQGPALGMDGYLVNDLVQAAAMWAIVIVVALVNRGKVAQQPLQRRAA